MFLLLRFFVSLTLEKKYGGNRKDGNSLKLAKNFWTDTLRRSARHPVVSGQKPSPLFWFTTSEVFTKKIEVTENSKTKSNRSFFSNRNLSLTKFGRLPCKTTPHRNLNQSLKYNKMRCKVCYRKFDIKGKMKRHYEMDHPPQPLKC